MIKLLINGINGKMGQEVVKSLKDYPDICLVGGLDKFTSSNSTYPTFQDFNFVSEMPDIVIDFSVPEATISLLPNLVCKSIPIVIATTGFNKDEQNQIIDASLKIPIFQSANMSYQIALMGKILSQVSKELPNSEIEIVDIHHNGKLDAPSGTALMLAEKINSANNNKFYYEFNRFNKHEKRKQNEIGFSSIRGGNVVGKHQVLFFDDNEVLEIKHTAYSRSIFADGAIKAAKFLVSKKAGIYDMGDLFS